MKANPVLREDEESMKRSRVRTNLKIYLYKYHENIYSIFYFKNLMKMFKLRGIKLKLGDMVWMD